ncbi:MAG: class I SAM-dependent methyltransferase [Fluviicola sp.]|nr:class I SAM-dependent methyltransferase [Fluviicola sp.]
MTETFWNERYDDETFVYGTEPNAFFKHFLDHSNIGSVLLPADGEGRNALYALQHGWDVTSFDYSEVACNKAKSFVREHQFELNCKAASLESFDTQEQFDVIAFVFVPVHEQQLEAMINRYIGFLKPKGKLILEAFTKDQLQNTSGGPKDPNFLLDLKTVQSIHFKHAHLLYIYTQCVELDEGPFHQGRAHVIRLMLEKEA